MRVDRRDMAIIFMCFLLCISSGCTPKAPDAKASIACDTLLELNIINKDDIGKDDFITNYEALDVILKIALDTDYTSRDNYILADWYDIDYAELFQPLDYLDDDYKLMLLKSLTWEILIIDDLLTTALDENATYLDALTFTIRLIGDTYSCTDRPAELRYTEKAEIYKTAYEKGLISDENTENADSAIPRESYYELIYNAINTEQSVGGYVPRTMRYIDVLRARTESIPDDGEAVVTQSTEISVDYSIGDDLSVAWTLPPEYEFLFGEGYSVDFSLIAEDGTCIEEYGVTSSMSYYTDGLDDEYLVEAMTETYSKKPKIFRCTPHKYNDDYSELEEWYFDIDLSCIEVIIAGDAVEPGTFIRNAGQWTAKSMTLADGRNFRAGAWYLITSYSHRYRKPEYNGFTTSIFKSTKETDSIGSEDERMYLYIDFGSPTELHLQEITISKKADGVFVLLVTPESKGIFAVAEDSGEA